MLAKQGVSMPHWSGHKRNFFFFLIEIISDHVLLSRDCSSNQLCGDKRDGNKCPGRAEALEMHRIYAEHIHYQPKTIYVPWTILNMSMILKSSLLPQQGVFPGDATVLYFPFWWKNNQYLGFQNGYTAKSCKCNIVNLQCPTVSLVTL